MARTISWAESSYNRFPFAPQSASSGHQRYLLDYTLRELQIIGRQEDEIEDTTWRAGKLERPDEEAKSVHVSQPCNQSKIQHERTFATQTIVGYHLLSATWLIFESSKQYAGKCGDNECDRYDEVVWLSYQSSGRIFGELTSIRAILWSTYGHELVGRDRERRQMVEEQCEGSAQCLWNWRIKAVRISPVIGSVCTYSHIISQLKCDEVFFFTVKSIHLNIAY